MLERLRRLEALRGRETLADAGDLALHANVKMVKLWQQQRLRRCYADLGADPRYAAAVAFFLDELYGTKDSAIRDRDLIRMYPTMKRLLPQFAFETVDRALELDVLAEEFDQALAKELAGTALTEGSYAVAFRAVGSRTGRLHQVKLLREVGNGLDRMVGKPLIFSTLKMLRKPAQLAGLGEIQKFLEKGFSAFRHMKGAEHFLRIIAEREIVLIERLFDNHADPFAIVTQWERHQGKS
jgi:hypothetical protein